MHRFVKYTTSTATSVEYLHRDHLGSVDIITNSSAAVVLNNSFDPYGARRESDWSKDATSTTLAQFNWVPDVYGSRGFTGHEHLDHTGIRSGPRKSDSAIRWNPA